MVSTATPKYNNDKRLSSNNFKSETTSSPQAIQRIVSQKAFHNPEKENLLASNPESRRETIGVPNVI